MASVRPPAQRIPNDRYAEYRDMAAVRERRLITHEILASLSLVHDLDLDESVEALDSSST